MCEDHVIALNNVGATNFESCDDQVHLTLRHNSYKTEVLVQSIKLKSLAFCVSTKNLAPLGT